MPAYSKQLLLHQPIHQHSPMLRLRRFNRFAQATLMWRCATHYFARTCERCTLKGYRCTTLPQDMTWSLREVVLRLLFAHIRGHSVVPALTEVEAEGVVEVEAEGAVEAAPAGAGDQEPLDCEASLPADPQVSDVLSGVGGLSELC